MGTPVSSTPTLIPAPRVSPHSNSAPIILTPYGIGGGAGIKVGVLDTGVPNHPDLKVTDYADFTGSGPEDRHGHA
nr:S8 family serine peptidase [Bacillota bacterium]